MGEPRHYFIYYINIKIMVVFFIFFHFFFLLVVIFLSLLLSIAIYRLQVTTFLTLAGVAIGAVFIEQYSSTFKAFSNCIIYSLYTI
jgi:hypothetical protein